MCQVTTAESEQFETNIESWADLSQLIEHFSYWNGHDWLFRGATDHRYDLRPKIGRKESRKKVDSGRLPYQRKDEAAVFAMFKQQARPHVGPSPLTEIEWLAVAQHHGLPTRLLDWTDSLLVAAWFAVEKGGAKSDAKIDSAIWVTKNIRSVEPKSYDTPLDLRKPAIYRPPHISPRIGAQGSVFLICPDPVNEPVLPFVKKITIARKTEFTLKKRLNACGVNGRHLFPDLGGLSEHLAWMYKNDWLSGYRSVGEGPESK
jgi:hypothetical protein